jgi:hypothetical protein
VAPQSSAYSFIRLASEADIAKPKIMSGLGQTWLMHRSKVTTFLGVKAIDPYCFAKVTS